MRIFVESNFVLELAFLREEHESCSALLEAAERQEISLWIPSFCLGEPYGSIHRRHADRRQLHDKLHQEINELARSLPYSQVREEYRDVTQFLLTSTKNEADRLSRALIQVAQVARIIPLDVATVQSAVDFQRSRLLSPQDSLVYASILDELRRSPVEPGCFVTKDAKAFVNPDVRADLEQFQSRLFTRFKDALGYSASSLSR